MEPQSDSTEWLSTCYFYLASQEAQHEHMMGPDAMIFIFWMLSFKPAFSFSSFTLIKRLFSPLYFLPLEWYHLHIWYCWYFSWQSWFELVIIQPGIPWSAYKLSKQDDNIQPCHTSLPIWNQSVVPCMILTVVSWPAHRFRRRQVRWSGIPII